MQSCLPTPYCVLQIRLKTLRRRARLLYLPAYVADYKFGEQFNAHGERRPQRFQAVVSGMDPASIAAERHYSPHKVLPLLDHLADLLSGLFKRLWVLASMLWTPLPACS